MKLIFLNTIMIIFYAVSSSSISGGYRERLNQVSMMNTMLTCSCVSGLMCHVEHCCVLSIFTPSPTKHSLAKLRSTEGRAGYFIDGSYALP